MKLLTSLVFVAAAVAGGDAGAAELKMFSSRALATVLEVIGQQFEQSSGHKLNVIVGFSPEFAPRINGGEAFDLMMSPPPVIDGYIKDGKLKADTRTMLVSSDVGVGVKAGASKPDISTVDAFKAAVLKAKSVSYPVAGGAATARTARDRGGRQAESDNPEHGHRLRARRQGRGRDGDRGRHAKS